MDETIKSELLEACCEAENDCVVVSWGELLTAAVTLLKALPQDMTVAAAIEHMEAVNDEG